MNKVILLGRMAREPEVRFTQGNEPTAVCRFSVAVERPVSCTHLDVYKRQIVCIL